jgi:hypothetical protein
VVDIDDYGLHAATGHHPSVDYRLDPFRSDSRSRGFLYLSTFPS